MTFTAVILSEPAKAGESKDPKTCILTMLLAGVLTKLVSPHLTMPT